MLKRVYSLSQAERIWVFSDPHFDHKNIIRYCERPFRNVDEMNETIVKNWNETVGPNDTVYFLGDMTFGWGSKGVQYWLSRLNGHIVYIKGSHDMGVRAPSDVEVTVDDEMLEMTHDPDYPGRPHTPGRWTIHGHKHHRRPFVDPLQRRVNVSAEVVSYRPRSLAGIVRSIERAGS